MAFSASASAVPNAQEWQHNYGAPNKWKKRLAPRMGENVVRMGKSVVMKPGMTISCHCPGKDRFTTFLMGTGALYTKSLPFWCALLPTLHYWDVTVASGHLKSLAPQLFVQQLIQGGNGENINAPHYMWMQEWLVDSPHKGLVMQSVSIPWFLWYLYSCIKSYNELQ